MNTNNRIYSRRDYFAYFLFWSWNLVFLAFMVLGFAPRLLPELLVEVRRGMTPAIFLLYGLVLTLIPVGTVILGLTVLRRHPGRLFAMGYVVEGPLMLVLVIRFFVIRQVTPGLQVLLVVALLGMGAFLWHVLDRRPEPRRRWVYFLRLAGLTLMLLTSLYAAVWITFYTVPLIGVAVNWLVQTFSDLSLFFSSLLRQLRSLVESGWGWVPVVVLGFILLLYTLTLFALAPLAIPILTIRAWWRSLQRAASGSGWLPAVVLVVLVLVGAVSLFVFENRQPQQQAFALLAETPESQAEVNQLLKQRESIRSGLLNAYLAPFRYFSARGEVAHIRLFYQDILGLEYEQAVEVQQMYENVARPLLYDPVHPQDGTDLRDNVAFRAEPEEAARLYQRFFDTPIIEAEREAIVAAVRSTWSASQAEAAWLAVDNREVRLVQQEVSVSEYGDWAEIELLEVYQNQTSDLQEVVYYFNLPESAVLTGVWLGDSPDRARRYEFTVAPRGAAQAVYRNEVRRQVDPALLEQIGPRQYRLRAYPVPSRRTSWDENGTIRTVHDAPYFYLWLTYTTLAEADGWPLPQLAFHHNIFWDADTVRLIEGVKPDPEEWLPEIVPAAGPVTHHSHRVDFPGDLSVLAAPAPESQGGLSLAGLPLAVVLDRSYSMEAYADQVVGLLSRLETLTGAARVDVYLTASSYRGEPPRVIRLEDYLPAEEVYFGGQNAAELLAQFADLRRDESYAAVLVLTDGSGYELGQTEVEISPPDLPVWVLHLGGDIPLGYDDPTLEAIQASGGGVSDSLEEALARLRLSREQKLSTNPDSPAYTDLVDGYIWQVLPTSSLGSGSSGFITGEEGFAALAARQLVLSELRARRGLLDDPAVLDELHALAFEHQIVTPYSSMIVLVNAQQRDLLAQLSEADRSDRYQREVEALGETAPATTTPLAGVPEPEEWLLILLAASLLAWMAYRRRTSLGIELNR